MKTIFAFVSLLASFQSQAACWTITDADQRAYCRAIETNSRMQCSAIGDFGLRTRCYVQTGASKAHCNSIRDSWQRKQCLQTGKR